MENRVFIAQQPKYDRDLSSAQRYGKLEVILSTSDKPGYAPGPCLLKMRKAFAEAKPEDYFVWAGGDPVGAFLFGLAAADLPFDSIKMLRWERELSTSGERTGGGFYVPFTVNKKPLRKEFKDHAERDY